MVAQPRGRSAIRSCLGLLASALSPPTVGEATGTPGPARLRHRPFLVLLAIVGLLVVESRYQPLVTANHGEGWDGHVYADMTRRLDFPSEPRPYKYRVLLPLAVHFLPVGADEVAKFRIVNTVVAAAFMGLLYELLAVCTPSAAAAGAAWVLAVTAELSPARMVFLYPVLTDYLNLLFTVAVFRCGLALRAPRRRLTAVGLVLAATALWFGATLNRENFPSNLVLVVCLAGLVDRRIRWPVPGLGVASVVGAGAGAAVALGVVRWMTGSNPLTGRLAEYLHLLLAPSFLPVAVAVISVYGAFLLLAIGRRVDGDEVHRVSGALVVLTTVVALGGGNNPERFLYWGIPFLAVWALPYLEESFRRREYGRLTVIFGFHVLIQRLLFPIFAGGFGARGKGADYGWVEILTGQSQMMAHWSRFATPAMLWKMTAAFAVAAMVMLVLGARPRVAGRSR
jgi:hypothetical protein